MLALTKAGRTPRRSRTLPSRHAAGRGLHGNRRTAKNQRRPKAAATGADSSRLLPSADTRTQGDRHAPLLTDMSRRYRKRHASPAAVAPFTPCAEPTTQRTGEAWRNLPRHAAIPARPPRAVGGRRPTIIAIGNRLARQPPAARLCQYRAPAPPECRRPTPNR